MRGRTFDALLGELDRRQETMTDFLAPTSDLRLVPKPTPVPTDNGNPAPLAGVQLVVRGGINQALAVNDHAHGQIAERLRIPRRFYFELLNGYKPTLKGGHPAMADVLSYVVSERFRRIPEVRMVRELDGTARAFLSRGYRRIDNYQVMEHVAPMLIDRQQAGQVVIKRCEVTDTKLYVQWEYPDISGAVSVGDTVRAGGVLMNSEVGVGRVKVLPMIWRLVCTNGMVVSVKGAGFEHTHLGARLELESDGAAMEIYRSSTVQKADDALMAQLTDEVAALSDPERMEEIVRQLTDATEDRIEGDVPQAVEVLGNHLGLSKEERSGTLRSLIAGADLSRYGLLNAVTAQQHATENFDRGVDLQSDGWKVLNLPRAAWNEVAHAKAA